MSALTVLVAALAFGPLGPPLSVPAASRLSASRVASPPSASAVLTRDEEHPRVASLVGRLVNAKDPVSVLSKAGLTAAATYGGLLKALKKRRAWQVALVTITYMQCIAPRQLTNSHFTLAMGACGAAGEWRGAVALAEALFNSTHLQPDLISLNTALAVCGACGEVDEALKLLRVSIPRAGLQPDELSFNAALKAASQSGDDTRTATALFHEMRRTGVPPGPVAYATVITALRRGGRWRQALQLFDAMRASGVEADAFGYGAALAACNAGGLHDRALDIFDSMEAHGVEPTPFCYNEALGACRNEEAAMCERCLALLERMPKLDKVSYNAALDVLHGTDEGAALFEDALVSGSYDGIKLVSRRDGQWTLDLHGLSPGAAQQAVVWWFDHIQKPLLGVVDSGVRATLVDTDDSPRGSPMSAGAAGAVTARRDSQHDSDEGAHPPERPQQLTIIVGHGKHRSHWQRSARSPMRTVKSSVEAMLADAKAPVLPSQNKGTIEVCPSWVGQAAGGFVSWAESLRERRRNEFATGAALGGPNAVPITVDQKTRRDLEIGIPQ